MWFGGAETPQEGCLELKDQDGDVNQQTRYETLRQVSGVIASQADLNGVLENLARFLPSVVSFEFLGVSLHDPERQVSRLYAFGGTLAGGGEIGTEIPLAESSAATILLEGQKPIILNDMRKRQGFPISSNGRGRTGFGRCASSLYRRRDGGSAYLVFGTTRQKDYDEEDLKLMSTVSCPCGGGRGECSEFRGGAFLSATPGA